MLLTSQNLMGNTMALRRLTIYLMRSELTTFAQALNSDKTCSQHELDPETDIQGEFYFVPPSPSVPAWVKFVQPILADDFGLASTSVSGLLLLRASERLFAVTFGYGRSLLDMSKIEFQFGLRVALNLVDAGHLRSLDTKTFDDIVVSTNTQTSKSAELPAFGVDVSVDILRAVTGEPRDNSTVKRASGSDALVLNVDLEIEQLPKLCASMLTAFADTRYKSDFEWIDQLAIVRDDKLLNQLDNLLVDDLRSGDASSSHLAAPENINWEDIDVFLIGGTRGQEYSELDLEDYLLHLGPKKVSISASTLRSRRVSVRYSRTGGTDQKWPLYRCIVAEQRIGEDLYVLIEGRWFAASQTLVEEVDRFVNGIDLPTSTLSDAIHGEVEKSYNRRIADSSNGSLLNLDARIKRPGGAASGIEFCDLLSDTGELIHVKRKSASSTLSHLFAQGSVSATSFVNDGAFRDEVRKEIPNLVDSADRKKWLELIPDSRSNVDRSLYSVTYAVVANSRREKNDWLPFFSKLNLMHHAHQIRNLGLKLALIRIDIT